MIVTIRSSSSVVSSPALNNNKTIRYLNIEWDGNLAGERTAC